MCINGRSTASAQSVSGQQKNLILVEKESDDVEISRNQSRRNDNHENSHIISAILALNLFLFTCKCSRSVLPVF